MVDGTNGLTGVLAPWFAEEAFTPGRGRAAIQGRAETEPIAEARSPEAESAMCLHAQVSIKAQNSYGVLPFCCM